MAASKDYTDSLNAYFDALELSDNQKKLETAVKVATALPAATQPEAGGRIAASQGQAKYRVLRSLADMNGVLLSDLPRESGISPVEAFDVVEDLRNYNFIVVDNNPGSTPQVSITSDGLRFIDSA